MKKIIVFDVDGVITNSWERKDTIIREVLKKHELLNIPWADEILEAWLNRVYMLEKLQEIQNFDFNRVLSDINSSLRNLESYVELIPDTEAFIQSHFQDYDFFTNTSMPKAKLINIFTQKDFTQYFMELLAYEDGSKRENIEYIMQVYGVNPEDILFIDDKQVHIDAVKSSWVHTLLFRQDGVSLEQKIQQTFW